MSGVKGRSGRRTLTDEIRLREMRQQVIAKSWRVANAHLDSAANDKVALAQAICVKSMPTEVKQELNARIVTEQEQSIIDKYIGVNRLGAGN